MERLFVIILSALPVAEWRVAVPFSMLKYRLGPAETFVLVLFGTMLPVFFIVYFAGPVITFISKRFPKLGKFIQKILIKIRKSKKGIFEVLESAALILLSALPVPVIGGAYTAAAAAFIFGIPPKKSILFIMIGSSAGIMFMIFLTVKGLAKI